MKNKIKILIGIGITLIFFFFIWKITGNSVNEKNYDNFAKELSAKGVKMYGTFWCGHCQNQKKMFGNSWKYINYVECSTPDGKGMTEECKAAGIKGYPTWEFPNGVKIPGELTLEQISERSGVPLQ